MSLLRIRGYRHRSVLTTTEVKCEANEVVLEHAITAIEHLSNILPYPRYVVLLQVPSSSDARCVTALIPIRRLPTSERDSSRLFPSVTFPWFSTVIRSTAESATQKKRSGTSESAPDRIISFVSNKSSLPRSNASSVPFPIPTGRWMRVRSVRSEALRIMG
ncbi:uncharacterized protein EI97DRAFT_160406 [Westerdykella ornata]|uniref:Uncharacterized protein n=1 Tax=Westerdykella ornata TaxID=318751 RepID=A0A6A6JCD2_WESOR|nr:uncharacterized protein EI97DRAFT_160406 [Westerdykella ornata]KAF2273286.1 hypothetical protein EI97DRAFT_160406 [Westerdykella ornata]